MQQKSYEIIIIARSCKNCNLRAMPADLSEGIVDFVNIEGMIDKCVVKLKNILDRWRSYFLEDDLKEFEDILEYQRRIKTRVKLVLDNQGDV